MAVDLRYPIVLEKLLEYYHQAHIARLPLWQQCNPHEPADGNTFPVEKFLKSHGKFRRNTRLLRQLMAALVPVDGSSYLMQALRIKGPELILENFIPFGDPDITIRDLQLHAKERGTETWEHNVLTLASDVTGAAGRTILSGVINLISLGVFERIPEAVEALIQGMTTAAKLEKAGVIQDVAVAAPSAVQRWSAVDVRHSSFVSRNLPITFAGFDAKLKGPLVCQVAPVLNQIEPLTVIDMRGVESLMRAPQALFNPGQHIREALKLIARKKPPKLQKPHPSLVTILRTGGVVSLDEVLEIQRRESEIIAYQMPLNDSDILSMLRKGMKPQAIANLFRHTTTTTQRPYVQRPYVDEIILNLRNWIWGKVTTEEEDLKELARQKIAMENRRKRNLKRLKNIWKYPKEKFDAKFWDPPYVLKNATSKPDEGTMGI